ncbi:unnamed protein product [Amaranthus hypochondriacus]
MLLLFTFMEITNAVRLTPRSLREFDDRFQGGERIEAIDRVEENCGGLSEDECLMRRTLLAHIDYIYTQNENP